MSTSLAQQLKKLALPQTSIYEEDKKKASLLFDPKVAASFDRETFYEIGLSGFVELKKISPAFANYENTLFHSSSKDFERSVRSKDENERLNATIRSFLMKLSPYFLLQPAHKALEWLINRFQIHKYNLDDVFTLILPYHETKIFIRFVQILKLKETSDMWYWLKPIQKSGVPLTKQVLFEHCISNVGFLKFISDMTMKTVDEFGDSANALTTLYAFYCSTITGAIEKVNTVNEPFISSILPGLMECLSSPFIDMRAAGYIITGQLVSKVQLKKKIINHFVNKIFLFNTNLHYEAVLLLQLIFDTQPNARKMSKKSFINLNLNHMQMLCANLNTLINDGVDVTKFMVTFLNGILPLLQKDEENFRRFSKLPEMLISEVEFDGSIAEKLIECAVNRYTSNAMENKKSEDDSDIEIVDESFKDTNIIIEWYSSLMRNFEQKYPSQFDKIIKKKLKSNKNLSENRIKALNEILGFSPKIMEKLGDTFLFEKLYHHDSLMRIEAVKFLIGNYKKLLKADRKFLTESIVDRLTDDNDEVVSAMLALSMQQFVELLSGEVFAEHLTNIINRSHVSHKWQKSSDLAIGHLCILDVDLDQHSCLSVLPSMFPLDEDLKMAKKILKSPLGKKLTAHEDISEILKTNDRKIFCEKLFNVMKCCLWLPHSTSLVKLLNLFKNENSQNYVSILFVLILVSFDLKKNRSSYEVFHILDTIGNFVKSVHLTSLENYVLLSGETIDVFINKTKQSALPVESLLYLLKNLTDHTEISLSSKPWIDFHGKSFDIDVIIQLYELALDDNFHQYDLFYSNTLKWLLNKYNTSEQEKIEFLINFALRYIILKEENSAYTSLKIRTLRILNSLLQHVKDVSWFYKSNVLVMYIMLGLNSSKSVTRDLVFQALETIVNRTKQQKKDHFFIFFNEILSKKDELELDNNQLPQALYLLLSTNASVKKLNKTLHASMKDVLNCFIQLMVDNEVPYYVRSSLISILNLVISDNIISSLAPVAIDLLEQISKSDTSNVDKYQVDLIVNILGHMNSATLKSAINNESVWNLLKTSLKSTYPIKIENADPIYFCVLMMIQIDQDFMNILDSAKAKEVILLILNASVYGANPIITNTASKTIKRIELSSDHLLPILKSMETIVEQNKIDKEKKRKLLTPPLTVLDTKEWRIGVSLLEQIQSKKKLVGFEKILPALFGVLKESLNFEEQSAIEYTKQLLLTAILDCCQRMDFNTNTTKTLKDIVDIELVILCIRATQNPQTHHHALLLLSQIATMFPDQVLQYMMAIFTFIGSSVVRQDDAYSFQIITKIIESIIPILIKSKRDANSMEVDDELSELEPRVISILRIFVDALVDIPEHRRLPLFKKLLETLYGGHFLWIFLAIIFESHIMHGNQEKNTNEKDQPLKRSDFGISLVLEFSPEIIMENSLKLLRYLRSLPEDKPENEPQDVNPEVIFSTANHSAKQLRHFKYLIVTCLNQLLSSHLFIQKATAYSDQAALEQIYKSFIVANLTFIQIVSKTADSNIGKPQAKYWKVMLHHCYEVLDNTNNLLSVEMFITVIRGLIIHSSATVKRKSMEILNSKLQHNSAFFSECDHAIILSLLEPLTVIIKDIENEETQEGTNKQELELIQQTALLSLKLLTKLISKDDPEEFKQILNYVSHLIKSVKMSGNLLASVVLCLAELCSNLKAHAISKLPEFMPSLIKILKAQTDADSPELILLSVITAVYKIVETIPLFLSPYLEKLLYQLSILSSIWNNKASNKSSPVMNKLTLIKSKISTTIQPRVLIPVISQCYSLLLRKGHFDAIGPAMNILSEAFAGVTGQEFTSLQNDLTNFFLSALQFRSDYAESENISDAQIDEVEEHIIKALVALVLKLSESSFRPLYFKIYDWSVRDMTGNNKERAITFYRLSSYIAEGLRGLFILFAGHFIKNSVNILDACNVNKNKELYLSSEKKCCVLIEYIMKTLNSIFTYDSQNFVNKDRFETIMQPLVDQLDNTLCGTQALTVRSKDLIIPCVSQFAIATADDSLWKPLNYQILLKTRHNDADLRLIGLECMREMASKLGDSWLPLLPESVPFLAELLEDENPVVESATQKAIQTLETVLGEPLQKYF